MKNSPNNSIRTLHTLSTRSAFAVLVLLQQQPSVPQFYILTVNRIITTTNIHSEAAAAAVAELIKARQKDAAFVVQSVRMCGALEKRITDSC